MLRRPKMSKTVTFSKSEGYEAQNLVRHKPGLYSG